MADTRVFNVTQDKVVKLSEALKSHGIELDSNSSVGETNTGGWDISWKKDGDQLAITVNKHPFAEEEIFWSKMHDMLS